MLKAWWTVSCSADAKRFKMSKYFRKSNLFGKQKIVSIPEEVGMDIVEALDVLVFSDKKKSALLYQPEHPNKVPTEKIELDRSENEKCSTISVSAILDSANTEIKTFKIVSRLAINNTSIYFEYFSILYG